MSKGHDLAVVRSPGFSRWRWLYIARCSCGYQSDWFWQPDNAKRSALTHAGQVPRDGGAMSLLHITPGPSVVIAREDAGIRWCFACRAHLPHAWLLLDDPPERQPSYYDPVWMRECSRCGGDHTYFPGFGPL